MTRLCATAGLNRQAYYQQRKARERATIDEQLVLSLVRQHRQVQPKIGVRKLHGLIGPELARAGVKLGRDGLFDLMRKHDWASVSQKASVECQSKGVTLC